MAALFRRSSPPRLCGRVSNPRLELAFEPGAEISLEAHDPARRMRELDRLEVDRAVVSISTPIGCEALPAADAAELVDAYNDGIHEVAAASRGRLSAFAASVLDEPSPGELERRLDQGFVGLAMPSDALASTEAIERVAPLTEVLERRGSPLFVHPGPAPWSRPDPFPAGVPAWLTPVVQYTAQAQRAFFTWRAVGRGTRPALRVVFAIMAGGAPFLEGRWRTFSGSPGQIDPNLFVDTAAATRESLELTMSTYGAEQVVFGSDHPVLDGAAARQAVAALGAAAAELVLERNPSTAIESRGVT